MQMQGLGREEWLSIRDDMLMSQAVAQYVSTAYTSQLEAEVTPHSKLPLQD